MSDCALDQNAIWRNSSYRDNGTFVLSASRPVQGGLDKLYNLTISRRYELPVDLQKYDLTKGHATYSGFYVEDVAHNFVLHFDKFVVGNAGDSLSFHRGQQFSTKDRDHDAANNNCAIIHKAAWWYKDCFHSNLNGIYKTNGKAPYQDGLIWDAFGGFTYSMKVTEMKIRPLPTRDPMRSHPRRE